MLRLLHSRRLDIRAERFYAHAEKSLDDWLEVYNQVGDMRVTRSFWKSSDVRYLTVGFSLEVENPHKLSLPDAAQHWGQDELWIAAIELL